MSVAVNADGAEVDLLRQKMNTWHCLWLGQWHAKVRDEENALKELPTRLITIHFQLSALIVLMICHVLVGLKQKATWMNKEGIDGGGIGVISASELPQKCSSFT